ncbi:MAG: 4Fe-4S dicluster domain-containing protein [Firmicutes bacterium]|nr:4Fe-4S dicluster domain-containing protein [Bacillota bacterium]
MEKDAVILLKSKVRHWLDLLLEKYVVCAPVKNKADYKFTELEPGMEPCLSYTRTLIPPKKYLHPQQETLFSYKRTDGMEAQLPEFEKKTVVLGVHPCDARAIQIYDVVFGGDLPDIYYWHRRKNTIIVAISCTEPDENCFCMSFSDCGPTLDKKGYDLLLTDLGDRYVMEAGSLEGSMLIQHPGLFDRVTDADIQAKGRALEIAKLRVRSKIPDIKGLPAFLERHYEHDVWAKEAKKCVSCGACTMTCPTCFCYHMEDFNRFNLSEGERVRIWDSCQLFDFAEVAMGENFRRDREARLKWRIYHKLAYWPEQFGTLGCTGCGRCAHYCMADIDMTRSMAEIRGESIYA